MMELTNAQASTPRNRNPRAFSFTFEPTEERRRDGILRSAFMLIVAPFKSRPEPRGPWDETNTGDLTPWAYPLSLMRNAMASAVVTKDREKIEAVRGAVHAFCREIEADIDSMVPAREEESVTAIALEETALQCEAEPLEMAFVAAPSPTAAERAVLPLERHHEKLGALIRRLRTVARATRSASMVQAR